ncbi:hypothetical protein PVAP13_2KG168906 [Panicum virgatum]|uniref:Secreted protein n=1 Tax=Panicum virgatum TaxID=38727 RepID=A0A8T0VYP9_PANVG|nr:hypothetical protein PVAP13_2KG168906 [Panicum virgatum]
MKFARILKHLTFNFIFSHWVLFGPSPTRAQLRSGPSPMACTQVRFSNRFIESVLFLVSGTGGVGGSLSQDQGLLLR